MRKNMQFLLVSVIILFFMIMMTDFSYTPRIMLWLLWASWSSLVAIMYSIIWRESVDCKCLEKEEEKIGMVVDSSLTFEEAHKKAVEEVTKEKEE